MDVITYPLLTTDSGTNDDHVSYITVCIHAVNYMISHGMEVGPLPRGHCSKDFKCIFLNENVLISIKISLKFVPKGQINNIPALV